MGFISFTQHVSGSFDFATRCAMLGEHRGVELPALEELEVVVQMRDITYFQHESLRRIHIVRNTPGSRVALFCIAATCLLAGTRLP